MRSGKKKSFHEHLLAIGVAIVLVAAASVAVNRSGLLTADLLQGGATVPGMGDISYSTDNSTLRIHTEKGFADAKSLTFMVVYNPESVTLQVKNTETQYDYTSSSGKEGVEHVTVFLPETLSADQQIVSLPFEGNADEVIISDATMLFTEGTIDTLAIKKQ